MILWPKWPRLPVYDRRTDEEAEAEAEARPLHRATRMIDLLEELGNYERTPKEGLREDEQRRHGGYIAAQVAAS